MGRSWIMTSQKRPYMSCLGSPCTWLWPEETIGPCTTTQWLGADPKQAHHLLVMAEFCKFVSIHPKLWASDIRVFWFSCQFLLLFLFPCRHATCWWTGCLNLHVVVSWIHAPSVMGRRTTLQWWAQRPDDVYGCRGRRVWKDSRLPDTNMTAETIDSWKGIYIYMIYWIGIYRIYIYYVVSFSNA